MTAQSAHIRLYRDDNMIGEFAFNRQFKEIQKRKGNELDLIGDLEPESFNPEQLHKLPVRRVGLAFLGR